MRRRELGLSQEKLGETLGITFQQVQKYEKGKNRIGASRLLEIAKCLNAPVSFFFPEFEWDSLIVDKSAEPNGAAAKSEIMSDALAMIQLFAEITDPELRKRIVSLVRILSEHHRASNAES